MREGENETFISKQKDIVLQTGEGKPELKISTYSTTIENSSGLGNSNLSIPSKSHPLIKAVTRNSNEGFEKNQKFKFKCDFTDCSKIYAQNFRLTIHKRIHTGEKPFRCTICDKSFSESGNLKVHTRIHTGEKPYICSYQDCNKCFKACGQLKDHIQKHLNMRVYKCGKCSKSFNRNSILKIHMLIHEGIKSHRCPYEKCSKCFRDKSNLRKHTKVHERRCVMGKAIFKGNERDFNVNKFNLKENTLVLYDNDDMNICSNSNAKILEEDNTKNITLTEENYSRLYKLFDYTALESSVYTKNSNCQSLEMGWLVSSNFN